MSARYKRTAENKRRAADARAALQALVRRGYEPENAMRDLLTNLMHLDAQTGAFNPDNEPDSFQFELARAEEHFAEERDGSA